jgi:hypothetical protein
MASKERLPEPKRVQSVVEWQYPRAHTYWDDCGKLIAAVENAFPGLTCQGLQPDGFHFVGLSKGITGAIFYWDKASITQAGRGDAGLAVAAGLFWPLVQQRLVVNRVNRLGHRTWLCYERASVTDGIRWLDGFKFVTPAVDGADALGTPTALGSVLRTKLEVGGRRLRLEANAGTAVIDKKETHGVLIDVDLVIEPPDPTFESAEFVAWNVGFVRNTIDPMFRRK